VQLVSIFISLEPCGLRRANGRFAALGLQHHTRIGDRRATVVAHEAIIDRTVAFGVVGGVVIVTTRQRGNRGRKRERHTGDARDRPDCRHLRLHYQRQKNRSA
jgi:hypothetical protein